MGQGLVRFWHPSTNRVPGAAVMKRGSTRTQGSMVIENSGLGNEKEEGKEKELEGYRMVKDEIVSFEEHNEVVETAWGQNLVRECILPDEEKRSELATGKMRRVANFKKILMAEKCELAELKKLSWNGIPACVRRESWQILMSYLPLNLDRRQMILDRKRQEYLDFLNQYYDVDIISRTDSDFKCRHQIILDVQRTHSNMDFFRMPSIQKSLERILFIWSARHPACGYVQGINDLATPFMLLCFTECVEFESANFTENSLSEKELLNCEADSFWCLTRLLDGIQDNYIHSQPGVQRNVYKLRELINRIDSELCAHLETHDCQFIQFAYRWMNNLLMRELPLHLVIRLWDTYLSEDDDGFSVFHLYVCVAFLIFWKKELLKLEEFSALVEFLQHLPTANWAEKEIESLVSQAFVYKSYYHYAPSHLH